MNKDDYKALKDALCRHDVAFDDRRQVGWKEEMQEFDRLQKELDNAKHSVEKNAVYPPFLSKYEG